MVMIKAGHHVVPWDSVASFEAAEDGSRGLVVVLHLRHPIIRPNGRQPVWQLTAEGSDARAVWAAVTDYLRQGLRLANASEEVRHAA